MIDGIRENQEYILRIKSADEYMGINLYDQCSKDIGPDLNPITGGPVTGLTENTFETDANGRKNEIRGTRQIMEDRLQLPKGTLIPANRFQDVKEAAKNFWAIFSVKVDKSEVKLHSGNPEHMLQILFLKAQSEVAFGIDKMTAKTKYILYTKQDESAQANTKRKMRTKAIKLFDELTLDERAEILELSGTRTGSLTPETIEDKLGEWAETYPTKFVTLVNDPMREKKKFTNKCLEAGIISIVEGIYVYGDITLGFDITSATAAIHDVDNTKVLEALNMQLTEMNTPKEGVDLTK